MYKVAVAQYAPRLKVVDYNLKKMLAVLSDIETDLIVFPELATTGYVFYSKEEVLSISESIPDGMVFNILLKIAAVKEMSIVYGFAEKAGDKVFNSSVLLNPDGTYHVYRKIHLFKNEKRYFSPGDKPFTVCKAKSGVKVGMMICFDWQFPEAARSLALQGTQIICHPSNLVLPWCQQAMLTRSLENRIYSITSNRVGEERNGNLCEKFTGMSQIVGTKGEVLKRLSDDCEEYAICDIDPDLALNKQVTELNNAFDDRRPELYNLG
ncbi:MAG: beta-ureidopropionase [Candidatus Cloacimonetes bacterium]|nr:beta-ureidopropionase [Candidatus Cloacimonadota bacterium]